MRRNQLSQLLFVFVMGLALMAPALAQDKNSDTANNSSSKSRVRTGQKQTIRGVIVKREADSFTLRDMSGSDVTVALNNATKVEERKSNPFRRSKNYGTTQLMRGLNIEVEGRGDNSGSLVAEKIKFSENDLAVAQTVESRVTPVEGRVGETETRISQAEQNAQRLSGQLEELSAISNAARGGAKAAQDSADAAQKTADQAVAGVNTTNERISNIVTGLDEYEPKKIAAVNFKVGSAVLSTEAKALLDEIADQAKTERGFMIEVTGFASSDGKADLNRRLSQNRADAVVRYLAENHMIPLRRIITPFGYGAAQPVADNSTRDGREQNRRVEVKILVNRGLTAPGGKPGIGSEPDTQSPGENTARVK